MEALINGIENILIFVCFILGVSFLFLALKKKTRDVSLKVAGLLFVLLIAIYADNSIVYIFALLVAATTITNNDFLENIAAIFRGGMKEVYKYKVKRLSKEEKMQKLQIDALEARNTEENNKETVQASQQIKGRIIEDYEVLENLALSKLEIIHSSPIEKYVKIGGKKSAVAFDGQIKREGLDLLFEIKHVSSIEKLKEDTIPQMQKKLEKYKKITGRPAKLYLAIFAGGIKGSKQKMQNELIKYTSENQLDIGVYVFDFAEIGYGR